MANYLHVTFDDNSCDRDLSGMCVGTLNNGEFTVLNMFLGKDAERLYKILAEPHGYNKWKYEAQPLKSIPSDMKVTCPACGYTKSRIDGEILHFCPNCGVNMHDEKRS